MKIDWNKKYTTIAVYTCLVILFTVICVFFSINYKITLAFIARILTIFNPIILGYVIAFILNPLMRKLESKAFAFVSKKKDRRVLRRVLSLIAAYLIVAILLSVFISILLPQIKDSYNELYKTFKSYVDSPDELLADLENYLTALSDKYDFVLKYVDTDRLLDSARDALNNSFNLLDVVSPFVVNFLSNIVASLKNALLGIILSIYFLYSKERLCAQFKKMCFAFGQQKKVDNRIRVIRNSGRTFENFITGKMLDSLIIGIITLFVCMAFGIPYYPLVSLIVCITNMIPFFGPFIGAIPSAFIILIADPSKCILFIILIIIIQQLDGNVIGPKILGNSLGLSPVWVMISIILMTGFLGITGMFIGVPLFAAIYAIASEQIDRKLKEKQMSTSINDYYKEDDIIFEQKPKKKFIFRIPKFIKKSK